MSTLPCFITGTRKGLFIHEKSADGWRVAHKAAQKKSQHSKRDVTRIA